LRTKRIISFCLWGDKPQYVNGALRAVSSAAIHYPGWTPRFYHDGTVPADAIAELCAHGAECWRKPDGQQAIGMFWRFDAMWDDPNAERFISRDVDSDFTRRETVAVQEWVDSGYDFHVMRDCESHDTSILGGMWGARAGCMPDYRVRLAMFMSKWQPHGGDERGAHYGGDQEFLHEFVWPVARNNSLVHDEHFPKRFDTDRPHYRSNDVRPFTVPLADVGGHYVGMVC